MAVRIFVAGGTGVLGRPLVRALVDAGHEVAASTHRVGAFPDVESLGARALLMEGLDERSVRAAVLEAKPDVIINQITSLSVPADDYGTWLAMTNKLRIHATKALMAAARTAGTRRVVAQSESFMTEPVGQGPTDESSPLYLEGPEPLRTHVMANVSAEMGVMGAREIDGVVLRYGFLYGEGTAIGPDGGIAAAVAAGDLPIVGEGAGRYPLIHLRDAVSATVLAVDRGAPGIYNIVDDEPAAQMTWIPYLAELLGAPAPQHISEDEAATRLGIQAVYYGNQLRAASNAKAKAELGLTLDFSSWRDGFREVFAGTAPRGRSGHEDQ